MAKSLSVIRAIVRQMLRDEFESAKDYEWPDDELDIYIQQVLSEISEVRPYEVKETLTTTAGSRELDISSITDLLEVDKIEYRVGKNPPQYRNCAVFGSTLTMVIDFLPSGSESVYLYCYKLHTLTEETSTLDPQIENTLVIGALAYATMSKAQSHIDKVNIGGSRTPADLQGWGMTKLALYKSAKKRIAKPKINTQYSRGSSGANHWDNW